MKTFTCCLLTLAMSVASLTDVKAKEPMNDDLRFDTKSSEILFGLLLPAVHKVREAAAVSPEEKGFVAATEANSILIGLLLPAVQKVREAAARSGNSKDLDVTLGDTEALIGLLLPAVQKVREAASRSSRVNIEEERAIIAILIGLLYENVEQVRVEAAFAGYNEVDLGKSDPTEVLVALLFN